MIKVVFVVPGTIPEVILKDISRKNMMVEIGKTAPLMSLIFGNRIKLLSY